MILRVRSTKLGKVRFVGHRDMARVWERALRRCGAPVAFTSGFTPRPRISFGLALPMGAESVAEYVDVEMNPAFGSLPDPDQIGAELSEVLPGGVDVTAVGIVERADTSLQEVVTSTTWELWGADLDGAAVQAACDLQDCAALPLARERKGVRGTDDVRPAIIDLRPSPDGMRLIAELATTGRGLRPAELAGLAFPGCDPLDVRVLRTHQWTDHGESRREVLSLSVPASTAQVGA